MMPDDESDNACEEPQDTLESQGLGMNAKYSCRKTPRR